MEHNFIENEIIILTKQTLDIFLQQENPSELISLYTFYYYTAKWQKTNQPKCTTEYVSKGLHWSRTKVAKVKKQLIEFGLIEDARIVDEKTKKVTGYYIKMNYVFKNKTIEKSQCTQNPPTGIKNTKASVLKTEGVDFEDTNALSTNNINALSTNIKVSKKKGDAKTAKKKTKKENKKIDEPNCKKNNRESFDEIIESYVRYAENDLVLENLLKEFLKMLAMKNKIPTNDTLKRNLSELFDYGKGNKYLMREIVERTNNGCWNKFFPLSADDEQKIIEEYTN